MRIDMRIDMKLVLFILTLPIVLLEANLNLLTDLFPSKAIINYLFPKDPNITRVRYPDEIKTEMNNVTTLDFIGLVRRYGYPAEEHYVTTEDGYNLVIHRIPGSPLSNKKKRKKVVYLQHGMIGSSDCWVWIRKSFAFLLADEGYDVWIGNVRGNSYCRSHVKLSPHDKEFWQFSYHEMSVIDLPVMIDYILSYTKQINLRYIGYSMGGSMLFVLLSMKPEYNAKIELGILFGVISRWKKMFFPFIYVKNAAPMIKEFLDSNEIYEIIPLSSMSIMMGRTLCADKTITQALCTALIFLMIGSDPAQLNTTVLSEVFSHMPAGTSVQTLFHCLQNENFQSYDYGHFGNYKHYGQATPIVYNLTKVSAPLAFFYGANDLIASKSNVLETSRHLPNVILLEEIPYKLFNHADFILATDAKALLYDRVIEILHEHDIY